ncbi:MAG TPA: CoA transferase, partial [Burkholderiaceae bacterium]|nr:CoA transferase [Burkholderiaceae bacterium]
GILGALGTLAAYIHRLRSGKGQWVQTSLLQASIQQLYWYAALFFSSGQLPQRLGTAHPIIAPYQTYTCSDGELALGGGNDAIWKRILTVIDKPEWEQDPRFVSPKTRLENREALAECLNQVLIKRTRKEWETEFLAAGVPAGSVQDVGEALQHPQTRAMDMVIDVEDANGGQCSALGFPVHFNGTNQPARSAAPLLGEHTREILMAAGITQQEYEALRQAQVCMDNDEAVPVAS